MRLIEQGRVVLLSAWLALSTIENAAGSQSPLHPMTLRAGGGSEAMDISNSGATSVHRGSNVTDPFLQLERFREFRAQAREERKEKRHNKKRKSAKAFLDKLPKSPRGKVEPVSQDEWKNIDAKQKKRGLSWFGGSDGTNAFSSSVLLDPSQYYDKWAQGYRMLGGFIDCDHDKSENSHDSGDGGGDDDGTGCSRWMMWAAYVNPNYQGNQYYEYFGDNPTSVLDCHSPDSDWELLGVYRQEFYQYIEQISKHLWAIDDYEYVVALAGLAYMTDYDCFYVGTDNSGNLIYAGVAPQPYGKFEMALYTDGYCLTPNTELDVTFDDYGLTSDVNLGSGDAEGDDAANNNQANGDVSDWWYNAQEYTLTDLNDVYEEFKYCTSCVDYPTYQDGYFIGDYGTDDDDLINQCWKFYSHDSFTCEAECIAMAHAQGSILSIKYGDATFGKSISGFNQASSTAPSESKFSRLLANVFLTISFLLFIATFLAFAVARRSRYRESRNSKSRRLLDDDGKRSKSTRRSSSRKPDEDGLFRSQSRSKSRAKSASRSKRSASKSRRSKSRGGYESPRDGKTRSTTKNSADFF